MSETFTIRPARMDEVESAAELLNEHSRRLHGTNDQPASELRLYWESPDVDFDNDVLLAEGPDGSLAGYADLGVHGDHVWIDVRAIDDEVLPGLIDAIEARSEERKPRANLIGFMSEADRPLADAYRGAGFSPIRHSFRMEIELDGAQLEPDWPDGFQVRTMREGEEQRMYEAHMETFADSWMYNRETFEVWTHWFIEDEAFDPALWFLVEHGDDLAGVALTRALENEPGLGWIRVLGVLSKYRRRGLGRALLRHTFAEYARRGFDRVGLGVDAENPTGAVRVYERAGMHVARKNVLLEKAKQG